MVNPLLPIQYHMPPLYAIIPIVIDIDSQFRLTSHTEVAHNCLFSYMLFPRTGQYNGFPYRAQG